MLGFRILDLLDSKDRVPPKGYKQPAKFINDSVWVYQLENEQRKYKCKPLRAEIRKQGLGPTKDFGPEIGHR